MAFEWWRKWWWSGRSPIGIRPHEEQHLEDKKREWRGEFDI